MNTSVIMPDKIRLNIKKTCLLLEFTHGDIRQFELSAEYLRVYSPSAEVRGHTKEKRKVQAGKKQVKITNLNLCGNYALKIIFDDRHDSGLYTWEYLYELCQNKEIYWQTYLDQLHRENASRDPNESVIKLIPIPSVIQNT